MKPNFCNSPYGTGDLEVQTASHSLACAAVSTRFQQTSTQMNMSQELQSMLFHYRTSLHLVRFGHQADRMIWEVGGTTPGLVHSDRSMLK